MRPGFPGKVRAGNYNPNEAVTVPGLWARFHDSFLHRRIDRQAFWWEGSRNFLSVPVFGLDVA